MPGEKRWIILASDGSHVSVGRHTDPSDEELENAAQHLRAADLGGWLAVMEGIYYSKGAVTLLNVREIAQAAVSWNEAVTAFQVRRRRAVTNAETPHGQSGPTG